MARSKKGASRADVHEEVQFVQRLFARERLAIDEGAPGRTCFLSHLGAQTKLAPGPWIGHRDLLYALALANLNPAQRTSLARAVLVEHGREFGVGRLRLEALASDLPMGGSSVLLRHVTGGPICLYTWALGPKATPARCDWMLLRAQSEWALDDASPALASRGVETLVELGGEILVLVESAVGAVQVASHFAGRVPLAAHPRFGPHLEGLDPEAPVLLWPHDALDGAGLRRRKVAAVILVGAPEPVRKDAQVWVSRQGERAELIQMRDVACPGRMSRAQLEVFWRACGQPRLMVRGDPAWAASGARWLRSLGAEVEVQGEATQLDLL